MITRFGTVFILCLLILVSCSKLQPISEAELAGSYVLHQDPVSRSGEAAKDAAMFSLLKFELVFFESHDYLYKHHLGGMMKEVKGKWHLSNDSLYTTNEHNPDVFQFQYLIQNREENGFRVMRSDSTLLYFVRK